MGMGAKAGRKPKVVQQTFALYEEEVRLVEHLRGFRRVFMVLTTHLPAIRDNDIVVLHMPGKLISGEADVLDHTHIRVEGGHKTALALKLRANESEEAKDE